MCHVVEIHTSAQQASTYEVSYKDSFFLRFSKVVSNSARADWNISVQKDDIPKLMNCKILLPIKQPKWISVTNEE